MPSSPVDLLGDPGIGEGIVAALQLSGPHADAGEAGAQLEPGRLGPDMHQRNEILSLDRLDHRAAGPGKPLAPLGYDSHDGRGIEAGRRDRLLHLEHRLEELGVRAASPPRPAFAR